MSIQKDYFYKEFMDREEMFIRAPYNPELEFYSCIKAGDVNRVKEMCIPKLTEKEGLGKLSDSYLQNIKYHFVITTALVARYCIEGGMELANAYRLSDFYIQKADQCKTPEEVADLHPVMAEDYAKRMKKLRKQKVCSRPVAMCLDYIYDHLHTRITVEQLADELKVNPSYLSRLFHKEVGTPISEFILNKKIETAKRMLAYSEFSAAEIAQTLAFSSQSHFTEVFKKMVGMTPKMYKKEFFRSIEIPDSDSGSKT